MTTEKPAIQSVLDTDLYKLTMQAAVLQLFPELEVEYEFNNRRISNVFNADAFRYIKRQVRMMRKLRTSPAEINFLRKKCPFLPEWYFPVLKAYRFDPNEVKIRLTKEGHLKVVISGLWWRTILWEVPLLAIISEAYFKFVDTNWTNAGQVERIQAKGLTLEAHHCSVADMSTRRRRDFDTQDMVVRELKKFQTFVGTSNPYLAMKHDVRPIGTMAHEWIMAHQVIAGIGHCNMVAMANWQKVYRGKLGIALPDTVGRNAFFEDMCLAQMSNVDLARLFDGVRHDSGDWKLFTDDCIKFYKSMGIDPLTKTIVFSDSLNVEKAIEIYEYCHGKIRCSFGIGTNFSNDFDNSPALNIVIKMVRVRWNNRWVPVVKLSDSPSKAIGDRDALRVTHWHVDGVPLDDPRWTVVAN